MFIDAARLDTVRAMSVEGDFLGVWSMSLELDWLCDFDRKAQTSALDLVQLKLTRGITLLGQSDGQWRSSHTRRPLFTRVAEHSARGRNPHSHLDYFAFWPIPSI